MMNSQNTHSQIHEEENPWPCPEPQPDFKPRKEKRFAVVMYGGVSLAIYINGVAQELFRLVESTAPDTDPGKLKGTARIYRCLAEKLGERYVVDILSGSSAGGINAIFLAKALANDQSLDKLEKLWVDEGDIARLLNDKKSKEGAVSPQAKESPRSPKALLNGARMYDKLLVALGGMKPNRPGPARCLVKDLDLFVTATDLNGIQVPIRLADELAYEQRYRHVFRFRKRDGQHTSDPPNDFKDENNQILAFAARCTSSFPFAFEPVLPKDYNLELENWKKFFERYLIKKEKKDVLPDSLMNRAFADGGYLDNKPFTYAIETIPERYSDIPGDRTLLYVEPSPEKIEKPGNNLVTPNAIENSLKAFSLARYETISEDLEMIRRRNTLVERAERVLQGTDADLNRLLETGDQPLTVGEYFKSDLEEMIKRHGFAYSGYLRLRVSDLTDNLSEIIASQAGFAVDSDEFIAFRYLVRSWRDDQYTYFDDDETAGSNEQSGASGQKGKREKYFTRFIIDYDLGFHVRRLDFAIKKIDSLLVMNEQGAQILETRKVEPSQLDNQELQRLRVVMSRERDCIRNIAEELRRGTGLSKFVQKLALSRKDLRVILGPTLEAKRLEKAGDLIKDRAKAVQELNSAIKKSVIKARKHIDTAKEAAGILPKIGLQKREDVGASPSEITRWLISHYIRMFPLYDIVTYQILHTANLGTEIDPVEVFRISPQDPDRLAGSRLWHFGGFLDRTWRRHDILRGRLDGARKIIASLLPGPEKKKERNDLINQAHLAIMKEIKENPQERLDLLSQVILGPSPDDRNATKNDLAKKSGSVSAKALKALGDTTSQESPPAGPGNGNKGDVSLEEAFKALAKITLRDVSAKSLKDLFESFEVDREVEPAFFSRSITRSIRVIGKILKKIGDEAGSTPGKRAGAWLTRIGAITTGLVEVLLPGNWLHLLGRRWLHLFMLFGIFLLILNALFDMEVVGLLGGAMVGGSAIILLVISALGIATRTGNPWPLLVIPVTVALILLGVGVVYTPDAIEAAREWIKSSLKL